MAEYREVVLNGKKVWMLDDAAIAAAVAEEREACARLVESCIAHSDPDGVRFTVPGHECCGWGCADTAHIAAAIRARGGQDG